MNSSIQKIESTEMNLAQDNIWASNLNKYIAIAKEEFPDFEFKKQNFYFIKSPSEDSSEEKNVAILQVRVALSDLEGKIIANKKYVMFQSFYDGGSLSTIDIVRLPLKNHNDIAPAYLNTILIAPISRQLTPASEGNLRFIVKGGFLEYALNQVPKFHGTSSAYSNMLSNYDFNDVATYLIEESGIFGNSPIQNLKGKEYVDKCLDIMVKRKSSDDFFSNLVDFYIAGEETEGAAHALCCIKAFDDAISKGEGVRQALKHEFSNGMMKTMRDRFSKNHSK